MVLLWTIIDGRTTDGRIINGRTTDGRTTDGCIIDGRTTDGRTTDGPLKVLGDQHFSVKCDQHGGK